MTSLRRHLRTLRRTLFSVLALGLIAMALVAGVTSQLLPLAERHPDRIAAWLSERADRPVAFDRVETEWTRRGPLLRLDGLRIGAGRGAFEIGDAELLVSQYAGLLPGRSFTELRLRGLDLTLERADDGRWRVRGLPGQEQADGDALSALERLGELQVIGGRLAVRAPSLGIDAVLPRVDVRLQVQGDRVRAGLRAWIATGAAPLDAALDFDRRSGDGRAYAGARRADLAAWSPLLQVAGVHVVGGRGRAEGWATLRGGRVTAVTVDADLDDVALRGALLGDSAPRQSFDAITARARWTSLAEGWRFDAPMLRVRSGDATQRLDGLLLAGGQRFALQARRVDAGPLFSAAALSDRLPAGMRRWLLAARPRATVADIEVAGERGGALRARGDVSALGFRPVGDAPGLDGLAGRLQGDADGFRFAFAPSSTLRFDWPRGFGVAHEATLRGTVSGWREGAGWRIGTDALRVRGKDFGVAVRGGLWWQGDGTRPRIDLAADIDDTAIPVAKGFWIHHRMSPATIRWLDAALVGGMVRDGRAVVSGDLDDWPFRDRDGLFRADARLDDATLKFQADWPAAEHLHGDVSFVADGFTVDGAATIAGVRIEHLEAGIPRFGQAELSVRANGAGDAAQLLALLRQSPLQREHGETLANIGAKGPAKVGFDMRLPLHRGGGEPEYGGTVALQGASLRERRWDLAFDQVSGSARYARDGFAADRLEVRHDGQPGRLSLRAGGFVRDRAQAFEADLEAMADADALLDRAPDMAWLKPHVAGRSAWTVGMSVPKAGRNVAGTGRLTLRSDLVGTALDLPAPLRKPASAPLAARIETPMPLDGGDVSVALGNVLAARARTTAGRTGVRVVLGASTVTELPPASGLVATGRAATLDAIDWIALAKGGGRADNGAGSTTAGSAASDGLSLQRIDVSAGQLRLLGATFPEARLQVAPAATGTAVNVSGPALAGSLLVPAADKAAIAGRFERVHWRGGEGDGDAAARPGSDVDIDPSAIPPLQFEIADLRFGDVRLGKAVVRTRPVATGLRIEQLQTRATAQRIDIAGDWLGRGAAARTRMDIAIDSDDFGQLLDGFGFGGQLDKGDGTARLTATWPGSPAAFSLSGMDGTLALDARDGRLLEVEPGAGRVLGLLSVAQLPRRLMFDFRDFFSKGFAFNRIDGHVRLAGGNARSDDLRIDGPAARIHIRGAADLRAQTFDQTIEVLPKAGNLLTVAGAIAAGPVGAAIGAAANAVLDKPLGQIAAKTYRVTGPWKDPKVEVLKREQSRRDVASGGSPSG
jgi:uncharacterized protein (TIGR02099 family)